MQFTLHADRRMNQRGISRRLIEFAMRYGRIDGDKRVLDRKESLRLIEELNEKLRLAKQILDKGGIAVVDEDNSVITAYSLRRSVKFFRSPTNRGRT